LSPSRGVAYRHVPGHVVRHVSLAVCLGGNSFPGHAARDWPAWPAPERDKGMTVYSNADLAEWAARILWSFAISEDHALASSRGAAYQAAETTFAAAYRAAYPGDSEDVVSRVRDILAELGPHDGYRDMPGYGIASYRAGALAERLHEWAARMASPYFWHSDSLA
jgi:hypothetical protein